MDAVTVSRLQFGITICYHYLFPPLSIGLGLALVLMEGTYLRTRNPLYQQLTRFWVRIFGLIFAMGVATGLVQEFQFGTNWAAYSRFVGDVFGTALAAEGIFAFFLESGFLAVLLFGWNRVGPRMHFFATVMVCLGAHFSAIWIVVANSWMQSPAGYELVEHNGMLRAQTTDFWEMVFNPSSVDRLWHVFMGCWQAGAFLVLSVSAWYLLRGRHEAFARAGFRVGLALAVVATLGSLVSGDSSARGVAQNQPAKLAAMEGVFPADEPAGLHLFGWVDEGNRRVIGPEVPGLLSFLVHRDTAAPVPGLDAVPPQDRPLVQATFQAFHIMVAIGFGLIGLSLLGLFYLWRGLLFRTRWLLWLFVLSVLGPQIANQAGWMVAEFGRQPWIVYRLLRTSQGVSTSVRVGEVWTSVIAFGAIYTLLFVLFIYLLNEKIRHGPADEDLTHSDPRERRLTSPEAHPEPGS